VIDASANTLLFLHIPKAAGTTLSRIAERQYPARHQYRVGPNAQADIQAFNELPVHKRAQYRYLAGHFPFGVHEQIPGSWDYITFLRDPVERVISFYYFIRSDPSHPWYSQLPDRLEVFAEQCTLPVFENGQTRQLAGDWGSLPFGSTDALLLKQAKQHLDQITVVGLAEEFLRSLLLLADRFQWKRLGYHNVNRNLAKPTKSPDPETLARLRHMNHLDIELYAYACKRFQQDWHMAEERLQAPYVAFEEQHPPPGRLRNLYDRLRSRTPGQWVGRIIR
jgi:hypothetical protein